MTDERVPPLDAMPTFATVDADCFDVQFCFRNLRLGISVDVDAPDQLDGAVNAYCIVSVFDDTTSVCHMLTSLREMHEILFIAKRDGEDAAYARALKLYRALTPNK